MGRDKKEKEGGLELRDSLCRGLRNLEKRFTKELRLKGTSVVLGHRETSRSSSEGVWVT